MDLTELAAQWRAKAAEITSSLVPPSSYATGLASGLNECAGELEDWLRYHRRAPDPAVVMRARQVIDARIQRYRDMAPPGTRMTLAQYLAMTEEELADFQHNGALSERIVRRFTATGFSRVQVHRPAGE